MTQLQLDWSSAEVSDGKLTVGLTDKPPKEWKATFEKTAALLNHGSWESITLKHGEIKVGTVATGEEERVKHLLESAVLEANAAVAGEDAVFDPDTSEEPDEDDRQPEDASPDEELTGRFRAFGAG